MMRMPAADMPKIGMKELETKFVIGMTSYQLHDHFTA